jgi:hypothetical protein
LPDDDESKNESAVMKKRVNDNRDNAEENLDVIITVVLRDKIINI